MFYIYAYLRQDNTPYYIGKGTGRRAWHNHNNCNARPPKDKSRIIIMEDNLTEVGALALERFYIRWYGKQCDGTGILKNKSDGGEGGGINSGNFQKGMIPWNKGKKDVNQSKRKKEYWNNWKEENPDYKLKWKTYQKIGYSDEVRRQRSETTQKRNAVTITCPHCNKSGQYANMKRWHFDNCKSLRKYNETIDIKKCE